MTTAAEPTTDRRAEDVVEDQSEQQHRDAPAATDADLGGIDEAIAAATAEGQPDDLTDETDEGDPRPDSLLAAIKALAPPYAFFQSQSKIPAVIRTFAQAIDADTPEITAYQVIWTAGEGGWQKPGIYQIGWMPQGCVCGDHPDRATGYRLEIDCPGIKVEHDEFTVEQAITALKAFRIIR